MTFPSRRTLTALFGLSTLLALGLPGAGCDSPEIVHAQASDDAGSEAGPDADADAGPTVTPSPVVISAATRTPVTVTRSINYWQWAPTYGDNVSGTEPLVSKLGLSVIRMGGYNNDANLPDPFDDAQMDKAVAYARAIGAEPLIQVPLLAGPDGMPATADTAAAMVRYANVTKSYGLKYFSIGNEPDLYAMQGGLTDSSAPAIPGYAPSDFCASASAYVTAMKAVDPTIKIVGPDLSYQYTPGSDFLTPILTTCGELFDIIAVHRYAGPSLQATLPRISKDVDGFRSTIQGLHQRIAAAGYGSKPLAITEMNIDYDALPSSNVPAAACGTVPSALWAVDILGASRELDLWTTALWDTSDDPAWQLGMIGAPPTHTPRPQYYAYLFYAEHSGPTRLDVTTSPAGVNVYASRNAADDTTHAILANWNTQAVVLELTVSALSTAAPAPVTYTLPALSIAALDIPDTGAASALVYGSKQHDAMGGPATLAQGIGPLDVDAGTDDAGSDAGTKKCPGITPAAPAITSGGKGMGSTLSFGAGSSKFGAYSYAGPGQTPPVATLTADGNGVQIDESFVLPISSSNNYAGFGLYYSSSSCIDASQYTGIQFDLSGDLGACFMGFAVTFSADVPPANDANRGFCAGTSGTCLPPQARVTMSSGTVQVPFASLSGGVPEPKLDPSSMIGLQWQFSSPTGATADGGGGCLASFTIQNVAFY